MNRKIIMTTTLIYENNNLNFHDLLKKEVNKLQEEGLEVTIQYQFGSGNHIAFMTGTIEE